MRLNVEQPETRFFSSRYGKIAYWYRPGERLILFAHGLGGCRYHFRHAFTALHKQGALAFDQLGFGQSERVLPPSECSSHLQVEALCELLAHLEISSIEVVLHSLSSVLLPALLAKPTIAIKRIFMVEGNLTARDCVWSQSLSNMTDDAFLAYFPRFVSSRKNVLKSQLVAPYPASDVLDDWSSCFSLADPSAIRSLAKEGSEKTLKGFVVDALDGDAKTIYIHGDRWLSQQPPGFIDGLVKSKNIDFFCIERCGHYPMLEKPDTFYQRIFSEG